MITAVYTLAAISFVALRLIRKAPKKTRQPVYYNDHDTTHSRYAINANGYLEEITSPKING